MKPRIIVIGSSNTDMIVKVPHLPLPGETVLGSGFSVVQGGKGANQAVAAARAGGDVVFIACMGIDSFGQKAVAGLAKEGINISWLKIMENVPSGIALINVAENGENSITVAPGANSYLLPEDILRVENIIKSADLVLVQLEVPLTTVKTTVQVARTNNIPVILNPAPAIPLDADIIRNIDILTPNEKEAALIAGLDGSNVGISELTRQLKITGCESFIITMGEKGAYYYHKGYENRVEGNKVKVVDTTAAGDTFNGYLAVSLAQGNPMEDAVRLANRAASLSVTRLGAQPSIPFLDEVMEWMD